MTLPPLNRKRIGIFSHMLLAPRHLSISMILVFSECFFNIRCDVFFFLYSRTLCHKYVSIDMEHTMQHTMQLVWIHSLCIPNWDHFLCFTFAYLQFICFSHHILRPHEQIRWTAPTLLWINKKAQQWCAMVGARTHRKSSFTVGQKDFQYWHNNFSFNWSYHGLALDLDITH